MTGVKCEDENQGSHAMGVRTKVGRENEPRAQIILAAN